MKSNLLMEKWDGTMLSINSVVSRLKGKCKAILAMHSLSGFDTVSYVCGIGKCSAYKALMNNDLKMLDKLGEENATQDQLMQASKSFFLALFKQPKAKCLNEAQLIFYKKRKKPPPLKNCPPTDLNLMLHTLRAHLQVMLWKAADKNSSPAASQDITKFGWEVTDWDVMPVIANQPVAPAGLLDIISCICSAEGRVCSPRCKCHSGRLSCTQFCKCEGGQSCMNEYSKKDESDSSEDEEIEEEYEE